MHDIQISHKFPGILFRFENAIDFTVFFWKTTMIKHKRSICLLDFIDVPPRLVSVRLCLNPFYAKANH